MKFKISPYFLVLILGIGYLSSKALVPTLIWAFVIAVSVIVHEMGHALSALFYGQKVEVELVAFGGLTKRYGKDLSPWQNFVIVFCGPFFGLILFYLCYLALPHANENSLAFYGLSVGIYVNLFWTLLNLLPVQPLDGGKLFGIILEKLFGHKGVRYSYLSSAIFAAVFALVGFVMGLMIVGILFSIFAVESFRMYGPVSSMTADDVNKEYLHKLDEAKESFHRGAFAESKGILDELLRHVKGGNLHTEATELLAKVLVYQNENESALSLLTSVSPKLSGTGILLAQRIAAELKEWKVARNYTERAYQVSPTADVARLNALIFDHLGEKEAAQGWSSRAAADQGVTE